MEHFNIPCLKCGIIESIPQTTYQSYIPNRCDFRKGFYYQISDCFDASKCKCSPFKEKIYNELIKFSYSRDLRSGNYFVLINAKITNQLDDYEKIMMGIPNLGDWYFYIPGEISIRDIALLEIKNKKDCKMIKYILKCDHCRYRWKIEKTCVIHKPMRL